MRHSREKYNELKDDFDPANSRILEKLLDDLEWMQNIFHLIKASMPCTGQSVTRFDNWNNELLGLIEGLQMQLSFQKSVEEL